MRRCAVSGTHRAHPRLPGRSPHAARAGDARPHRPAALPLPILKRCPASTSRSSPRSTATGFLPLHSSTSSTAMRSCTSSATRVPGESYLAAALGVEAVRAGHSVYFSPLADIIDLLAKVDREGRLRERIRFLCRASLLIIDEIGYLTVGATAGNLFFQLVNARYARRDDSDFKSRLCGMGRGFWRSCGRDRAAGQTPSPRRRRAYRRRQLPSAATRRPRPGSRAPEDHFQSGRRSAASARTATQKCAGTPSWS